jgi:hypothetical protein
MENAHTSRAIRINIPRDSVLLDKNAPPYAIVGLIAAILLRHF